MAAFDGTFLVRSHLRLESLRAKDPAQRAAIQAALADPDFVPAQVQALNEMTQANMVGGMPGFLALLLQYLPQIIALIMQIFGPKPAAEMPAPAPA